MFKRKFYQFIYDLKINYVANILYVFCFIIILLNLTTLLSWNLYADNIKANGKKYENYVGSRMQSNVAEELLKDYNKAGWLVDGFIVEEHHAYCANDVVFEICSSIPLAKGRMPKNEGEAIVNWSLRNDFSLGNTYNLEDGNKITVVGYTVEGYSISTTYPNHYSGWQPEIVFLSNN